MRVIIADDCAMPLDRVCVGNYCTDLTSRLSLLLTVLRRRIVGSSGSIAWFINAVQHFWARSSSPATAQTCHFIAIVAQVFSLSTGTGYVVKIIPSLNSGS